MALSIGILLDSATVSVWQRECITQIVQDPNLKIKLFILNTPTSEGDGDVSKFIYKLLRTIDRKLFPVRNDLFNRVSIDALIDSVGAIRCVTSKRNFTTQIDNADVERIKSYGLDVLIRFGFGIIKGGILKTSGYGVWSLHHGDNQVNRGGPPAFWEVVYRSPVTGVTLQKLTEQLDGGIVIGKSFVKTDFTSFNRNQNAVFLAGNELLVSSLKDLATGKLNHSAGHTTDFYSHPLYKDPTNLKAIAISFNYVVNQLVLAMRKFLFTQQWIILLRNGNNGALFQYKVLKGIGNQGNQTDWADPFPVEYQGQMALFFEEKEHGKNAHLACFKIDSSGKPEGENPVKITSEEFHLSYPFVVEHEKSLYMLPEAAASGAVWLFKCVSFPFKWEKLKRLLSVPLFDPTLVQHNGVWYLMGTQKPYEQSSPNQYLHIYYSDDLLNGQWIQHPLSPTMRDVRGARSAGKIFLKNGKLIRPGQVGSPKYGYGIRFFEITKLSTTEYEEVAIDTIEPLWSDNLLATHTFNSAGNLTVIDAQIQKFRFALNGQS